MFVPAPAAALGKQERGGTRPPRSQLDQLLVSLGDQTEAIPPRENNNSPRCLGRGPAAAAALATLGPAPRAAGPAPSQPR